MNQEIPQSSIDFHAGLMTVNQHSANRYMAYVLRRNTEHRSSVEDFIKPDVPLSVEGCIQLANDMAEDFKSNPRTGFLTMPTFSRRSGRSKRSLDKESPNAWGSVKLIFADAVRDHRKAQATTLRKVKAK